MGGVLRVGCGRELDICVGVWEEFECTRVLAASEASRMVQGEGCMVAGKAGTHLNHLRGSQLLMWPARVCASSSLMLSPCVQEVRVCVCVCVCVCMCV